MDVEMTPGTSIGTTTPAIGVGAVATPGPREWTMECPYCHLGTLAFTAAALTAHCAPCRTDYTLDTLPPALITMTRGSEGVVGMIAMVPPSVADKLRAYDRP